MTRRLQGLLLVMALIASCAAAIAAASSKENQFRIIVLHHPATHFTIHAPESSRKLTSPVISRTCRSTPSDSKGTVSLWAP